MTQFQVLERKMLRLAFLLILLFFWGSFFLNYRALYQHHAKNSQYLIMEPQQYAIQSKPSILETKRSPSPPLPCAKVFSNLTTSPNITSQHDLFRMILPTLTYEGRETWLRSLNPIIINSTEYLQTNVRTICNHGNQRIALVTVSNGILANIQEWCFYHLLLGVEKLFIYDDTVPDSIERSSFLSALQPFLQAGYVVLYDAHQHKHAHWGIKENNIHNHFLRYHREEYDWVGFIGTDEYVVVHTSLCLHDLLAKYTNFGGLVMQWNLRSMLGVPEHNPFQTHFEQYHCFFDDIVHHVKSFVQPKYVKEMLQHHANYNRGRYAVNVQQQRVNGPFNVPVDPPSEAFAVLELRHFFFGDWKFAFFEKACGLNAQREQYLMIRSQAVVDHALTSHCTIANDRLPPIHEHLRRILYHEIATEIRNGTR